MCQQCGAELVNPEMAAPPTGVAAEYAPQHPPYVADAVPADNISALDIRPFNGINAVISPTIDVFKNNLWLITKIVLVIFAPYEIVKALSFRDIVNWESAVVIFFLGVVCKTLAAPALIYALMTKLTTGVAPGLNESYRWGLSRMGRIIPASFLAWILEALGTICLIVPGILLALSFETVGPIATLEDHSPVDVLKRSYHLTKGYRGRIFGAGIVIGLLISVVSIPITMLAAIIGGGTQFWLLTAVGSMLIDVVNAATIILSLMIYLSLMRSVQEDQEQTDPDSL
ncbi:MAG TPA: hypothetical protein VGO91_06740 [Pyrinomonadaceae bacterium]|jgi:hypothetical protein|nr:hypothetical protein [Pyrinomonadaceae bacterium]